MADEIPLSEGHRNTSALEMNKFQSGHSAAANEIPGDSTINAFDILI